jgi:hypothetical protein
MTIQFQSHACRFGAIYRENQPGSTLFYAKDPKKPGDQALYPFYATGEDKVQVREAVRASQSTFPGTLQDLYTLYATLAQKAPKA